MKYRAEIDGLRAVAVLPVILFHAGFDLFGGGFVGVDVFFVISGYLITSIIITRLTEKDFSISYFYERRARRILPALFFVSIVCLPFAWFWLAPSDLKDFGQSLVAVSTFSSNILFWMESDYFDQSSELKPLLHTWSLAVEEQYYIIFPIFLLLAWRFGQTFILIFLFIIFIASLGLASWAALNKPVAAFYLLPTRGWEILMGVFAAFYIQHNAQVKHFFMSQLLSILGFGLIIISILVFDRSTPFPSLYTLIPTLGALLIIISAVPGTIIHKLLSLNILVGLGLISYSAYLWHQPILAFARHRFLDGISDFLLIALCILSVLLAWLTWCFIEKPFRDSKKFTRSNIFIFSLIGIVFLSSVGVAFSHKEYFPHRPQFSKELSESLTMPDKENCFDIPFNYYAEDWGCFLGAKKSEVDYILFGDSHTLSLKSLIDDLAFNRDLKVFYVGSSSCIPFLELQTKRVNYHQFNCNLLNKRVFNFAQKNKLKGIILSAKWTLYLQGNYSHERAQLIAKENMNDFTYNNIDAFREAFHKTVDKYSSIELPIHLIAQHPLQKYDAESAYFSVANGYKDLENLFIERSIVDEFNQIPLSIFAERVLDINLYEVTDLFCDQELCFIGDSHKSYYVDNNHLSTYGAIKLSDIIEDIFSMQ